MPVHLGAPVHPDDSRRPVGRSAGCRDAQARCRDGQAHHQDAQQGVELVKLCCRYAGPETGVERAPDAAGPETGVEQAPDVAGQALGDSQGQPVE